MRLGLSTRNIEDSWSDLYDPRVNGEGDPIRLGAGPQPSTPVEPTEGEYVLSLGTLLQVIWRRLWVVLLVAVVLAGAVVGNSLTQTPLYEASIEILVGQKRTGDTYVSPFDLERLAQTMTEGISSRPVSGAVIQQLDLRMTSEELLANLRVEQISETQFVRVYYADPSPQRAQRVANTVGEVFSKQIAEVSPSANAITATVWERAALPDDPVRPNPMRNGILALVLGLMIGVGLALLLEFLDDRWRSPEEVEQVAGVPTVGVIPELRR